MNRGTQFNLFEAGCFITDPSEIVYSIGDGEYYRWDGDLPKQVTAGSTPQSTGGIGEGAWVSVGDASLRSEFNDADGVALVGSTNYDGIRNYTGQRGKISAYGRENIFDGGVGVFVLDASDASSADNGGTILIDSLGRRWKRQYSGDVDVVWFGADPNGVLDSTDAFNRALKHEVVYDHKIHNVVRASGYKFNILGTVYVRKGCSLIGEGTRIYMGSTGSIRLGVRSNGIDDPGGAPVTVTGFWLEGGNKPIDAKISGYTVRNIFFSMPSVGAYFSGTDAVISGCIFDNGSTTCRLSTKTSTISNCIFYIANTQISFGETRSTVITNCTFNFAKVAALSWNGGLVKGVRFDNCVFTKNTQDESTFKGYIWIRDVESRANGDVTFTNCSFRNGYKSAYRLESFGDVQVSFNSCSFDSEKTSDPFAQSTTMYAAEIANSSQTSRTSFNNCEFTRLYENIIKINSNFYNVRINSCKLANNTSAHLLEINKGSSVSTIEIGDVAGEGKDLFNISSGAIFTLSVTGKLTDWLKVHSDGQNKYVNIPFTGPTLISATLSCSFNPAGSMQYRAVKKSLISISNDIKNGTINTIATLSDAFKSQSTVSAGNLNIKAAINDIATGSEIGSVIEQGNIVVYWPSSYDKEKISVSYE